MAKPLGQPVGLDLAQAVNFAEQLGPIAGEAQPDRLVPLLQVCVGLLLVPPALGPGQGGFTAAQPNLAAQEGALQLGDLGRGRGGRAGAAIGRHRDQLNPHRLPGEQLQMAGGAAVTQKQQVPTAAQAVATLAASTGLQHVLKAGLPDRAGRGQQIQGGLGWWGPG